MNERDTAVLVETIRRAVRDEVQHESGQVFAELIPRFMVSADLDAELLLVGAAIYGKRALGLDPEDFYATVHKALYRAALEGGDWVAIRARLTGDNNAIDLLYQQIRGFDFATEEERRHAAERVSELADRRRLRELMGRLEVELAHGHIDCSDAEVVLQRHLLRGQGQQE